MSDAPKLARWNVRVMYKITENRETGVSEFMEVTFSLEELSEIQDRIERMFDFRAIERILVTYGFNNGRVATVEETQSL